MKQKTVKKTPHILITSIFSLGVLFFLVYPDITSANFVTQIAAQNNKTISVATENQSTPIDTSSSEINTNTVTEKTITTESLDTKKKPLIEKLKKADGTDPNKLYNEALDL